MLWLAPLVQTPYEDAFTAYDQGDDATAISIYRTLADQGDPYVQRALGIMYDMGRGVPQDYVEAMKWYRRGRRPRRRAQNNLGLLDFNREGVPQNDIQAHMRLSLAAANALDKDGSRPCGSQPGTCWEQNDPGGAWRSAQAGRRMEAKVGAISSIWRRSRSM